MSTWTDERVATLKHLADQGVSYGIIAIRLGMTRNSVIGKANRLRLPPRIGQLRELAFKKRVEKDRRRAAREAKRVAAEAREAVKRAQKLPKVETGDIQALIAIPTNDYLSHNGCRWPHGEVCQNKALDMKSYCAEHHERSRA